MDRPPHRPEDPLRQLTRSMFRCGLAFSLLGAEGLAAAARGDGDGSPADAFDRAAHDAAGRLGEHSSSLFRTGERMGSSLLDAMADLGAGTPLDPRRTLRGAADLLADAADSLERMTGGGDRCRQHGPEE